VNPNDNLPAPASGGPLVLSTDYEAKFNEVLQRLSFIKRLKDSVLQQGVDYDTIPGTKKPTLLQPGAQKLLIAFGLTAKAVEEIEVLEDGDNAHLEVKVKVEIRGLKSDTFYGSATGSCTTRETRYAFRSGEGENTGQELPREYWDYAKGRPERGIPPNLEKAAEIIGGKEFVPRKVDGRWFIFKKGDGQVPNPNLADTYNTVRKIAFKRGLIAAVLLVTGTSEYFTQDVEDLDRHVVMSNERLERSRRSNDLREVNKESGAPPENAAPMTPTPEVLKLITAFVEVGIHTSGLEAWLGDRRSIHSISVGEMATLRMIYPSLKAKKVTWAEVMDRRRDEWSKFSPPEEYSSGVHDGQINEYP
jgi:hypothetical protein